MTKGGYFVHYTLSPCARKLGYQETTKNIQYKPVSMVPHV